MLSGKGLARYIGMPVHKCSVRVILPRPDVQRVERRETKAIRALEVMEKLSLELWRFSRMSLIPRVGEKKVVRADQAHTSAWNGLIDNDLWQRGIDFAVGSHRRILQECLLGKVESHGS